MDDREFCEAMQAIGHGDRSFGLLRMDAARRPLAASEQIADQLAEDIAREIIPPRGALREQALAERFGVSRGPIRDALRLLERDGLVQVSPNRGAVVTDYSIAEMRHIADISWPMTRLHLGLIFKKVSNEGFQAMLDAQKRVGQHLLRDEPVAFALALAAMSQKQARFVIGRPGEMILQLLYRPSIRYTIAGLKFDGAGNAAHNAWQAYIRATENRDSDEAARVVLTMLRDIHLPVLEKEAEANF